MEQESTISYNTEPYGIDPGDPRYVPQYDPNNSLFIPVEFRVFGMGGVPIDQRTLPQYQ